MNNNKCSHYKKIVLISNCSNSLSLILYVLYLQVKYSDNQSDYNNFSPTHLKIGMADNAHVLPIQVHLHHSLLLIRSLGSSLPIRIPGISLTGNGMSVSVI